MKRATIAILTLLASTQFARAECERDMADAKQTVPRIEDAKLRMRASYYLVRVQRELEEGDEFECSEAISAINEIAATTKLAPAAMSAK